MDSSYFDAQMIVINADDCYYCQKIPSGFIPAHENIIKPKLS